MSCRCLAPGLVLLASIASAQITPDCLQIAWDYEPRSYLGFFRIYMAPEGQPRALTAIIPAIPELVTQYPCDQLYPIGPGRYTVLLTAVSLDGTVESEPSQPVTITFGVPSFPMPDPPPPVVPPPPPPPRRWDPPPVVKGPIRLPLPPKKITETCWWEGSCR